MNKEMTSKESLETLFDLLCEREHINSEHNFLLKLYQSVKEDLEVLEILKEYFCYSDFGQWYIDIQESDFDFKSECSIEEWENSPQKKIKDWLSRKLIAEDYE